MLQKPNKSNYSQMKSWRPTSVLYYLDKGLEQLIARQIAVTALTHNVLNPQQIGALPKRATTDLAVCLVHDIEHALEGRHSVATIMTLDIQNAYNSVLRRRLLLRRRHQGWPKNIIYLISSSFDKGQAFVRLEETDTKR